MLLQSIAQAVSVLNTAELPQHTFKTQRTECRVYIVQIAVLEIHVLYVAIGRWRGGWVFNL